MEKWINNIFNNQGLNMKKIFISAVSAYLIVASSFSNASILDNGSYVISQCPATASSLPPDGSPGKFKAIHLSRFKIICAYENERTKDVFPGYEFRGAYDEYFRAEGVPYKNQGNDYYCDTNSYNPSDCQYKIKTIGSK